MQLQKSINVPPQTPLRREMPTKVMINAASVPNLKACEQDSKR